MWWDHSLLQISLWYAFHYYNNFLVKTTYLMLQNWLPRVSILECLYCRVSSFGCVSNMWLVLSIIFHCHYNIWGCMCSTCPFQFRWLKGYIYSPCYHYHHQIGSISLTHCYHIFSWLCDWDVCVTSYSVTYTYTFREDRDFVFIIIVQFIMMRSSSQIRFGL